MNYPTDLPNGDQYSHSDLTLQAAAARHTARTTKGPATREQARRDAKVFHAELDRRAAQHQDHADRTLRRFGRAGAAQIAHRILDALRAPDPASQPQTQNQP